MPYIDDAYLINALGADKVAKLAPTPGQKAALIKMATAEVRSALTQGGYSAAVPETVYPDVDDCPEEISLAAYGAWLTLAYGAVDLALPESFRIYVHKVLELKTGTLEIPGVPKVTSRAVGGVAFTPNTQPSDGDQRGRPQIFNRKTMAGF